MVSEMSVLKNKKSTTKTCVGTMIYVCLWHMNIYIHLVSVKKSIPQIVFSSNPQGGNGVGIEEEYFIIFPETSVLF